MLPTEWLKLYYRALARLLDIFFKLLYHQFACTYDWVAGAVSLGMWPDWVLAILPLINRWPVLEIGHGPGHLQSALKQRGIQTFGLDASRQMGKLAIKHLRRSGYLPSLVNGIAQALPFPNGALRSVVSTFPSEFITDPETLSEIWRVLVTGGDLYILPIAWITGKRWTERLAAWIFRFTKQSPNFQATKEGETNLEDWTSPWVKPIRDIGFRLDIEHLSLKSSTLLIIHGVKHLPGN
jgi:ubiquinone/menaquinone biosynthesis C-methylase UbiE